MKYFMEYCFVDRHSNFYALIASRQQENIEIFIIVVNIGNINVWNVKKDSSWLCKVILYLWIDGDLLKMWSTKLTLNINLDEESFLFASYGIHHEEQKSQRSHGLQMTSWKKILKLPLVFLIYFIYYIEVIYKRQMNNNIVVA